MKLESQIQKESYALGLNLAQNAGQLGVEIDRDALIAGFQTLVKGEAIALGDEEAQEVIQSLNARIQEAQQNAGAKVAEKFLAEGKAFLDENGKKDGVSTTESGLQYEVIHSADEGASPAAESQVKVHYEGKLLNDQVFDSSYKRNEPATFGLNQVIKGWGEGLQLMKVGDVFRFFIPADLAYGNRGAGQAIPPGATLIFQVELLEILD